eukprot:COSAG02_NODE_66993_length_254_cov_0.651613_2_plen_34_part_01
MLAFLLTLPDNRINAQVLTEPLHRCIDDISGSPV